ncbi:MAG: tripartite tricarboxylate transporter TctB family protein [Alcaligenaceae bacterium]|nr:tripartite tricarboxylate transporter TctB family protein [Alcaligenaceae bacterium]
MRFKVSINKRDVLASGLLCLLGLAAVLQVSASSVSRISGMGAGVLPVVLGSVLMLIGILWLFDSRLSPDEEDGIDIGVSKWRGSCGVVSGVFAFLLLSKYGGMLPAVFALVFVTVLGDRRHSWRSALLLASGGTLLAGLVLAFSPGLAFSMFRWG